MATKTYWVPSLFTTAVWSFEIKEPSTWKFDTEQWDEDRLIDHDVGKQWQAFGTTPSGLVVESFHIRLARNASHRDQTGARTNLANLAIFNPFAVLGSLHTTAKLQSATVVGSPGGKAPWLCFALGTSTLGKHDLVTPQFASAMAPATFGSQGQPARLPAFFCQLEQAASPTGPWYVLEATGEQTPQLAFDALNHAVREVRGTQHASLPFQGAVPAFRSDDALEAWTLTRLEDRTSGNVRAWSSRLLRVVLGSNAAGKQVTADLGWFQPHRDEGIASDFTGFSLRGTLQPTQDVPDQFQYRWDAGDAAHLAGIVEKMRRSGDERPDVIASVKLLNCDVVKRKSAQGNEIDNEWLRFGSIEIQPTGGGATLEYTLRGHIGTGSTAVYPECRILGLQCKVRVAPGSDPREVWSRRDGEALRESAPIVAVDVGVRTGTLAIETLHQPGRHATIELRLSLPGDADPGSALWINLRPFLVAKVGLPRDRNKETELTWKSNDEHGAQWRVTDPEVRLMLPPQAVGEEMERGGRFYPGGQPDSPIQSDGPIQYRFSRPTSLTLLPSPPEERRRFEKPSINLRELLRGAIVRKMTFEMAYPLEVSYDAADSKRTIVLTEVGEFLGQPAEVLPKDPTSLQEHWHLSRGMASYVAHQPAAQAKYEAGVEALAIAQTVAWDNFVSRIAELHVHDPTRPRGEMRLLEGVQARLRHAGQGAKHLANPLPADSTFDPATQSGANFRKFLNDQPNWAPPNSGSLRGGLIHSFEFPSELLEVLETPEAVSTVVETLCLSALGSSGKMEAAFASGKTTFAIVAAHGQLSRLVKTRLGRIGALWNRAKHVVVYERSTSRSAQFKTQQAATDAFDGWPILRKTEEYIEPVQLRRVFGDEENAEANATGFMHSCVFATQRIYVDGAWARDIGDGYEMPLWDERAAASDPKFYPRPQIGLECHGEGDKIVRLWFRQPDRLYFHSSTAPGTTVDTDKWKARAGVDFEAFLPRMPAPGRGALPPADSLAPRAPANPELCMSQRFDLAVDAEGPVNLQFSRGSTPMVVTLQRVSIGRGSQTAPVAPQHMPPALEQAQKKTQQASQVMQGVRSAPLSMEELRRQIEDRIGSIVFNGDPCANIQDELKALIRKHVSELKKALNPLRADELKTILQRAKDQWARSSTELGADLLQRGLVAEQVIEQRAKAARESVAALRKLMATWPEQLDQDQKKVLNGFATDVGLLASDVGDRADAFIGDAAQDITDRLVEASRKCAEALGEFDQAGRLADRCRAAQAKLVEASAKLEGLPPSSRKLLDPLRHWVRNLTDALRTVAETADYVDTLDTTIPQRIDAALKQLTEAVNALASTLSGWATAQVNAAASDVASKLMTASGALSSSLVEAASANRKSDVEAVLTRVDDLIGARATGMEAVCRNARAQLQDGLQKADAVVAELLVDAQQSPIGKLSTAIAGFTATADQVADKVAATMEELVDDAAGDCQKLLADLRKSTQEAIDWARQRVDAVISDVISTEAAQQIEQYAATAAKVWDVGSQAISLARAVGDLPKITPLEFDIDAADYVFDGKLPSIRMTPAVARLQQQGEKLLEALGIAMPCDRLLDQLVPDVPPNLFNFNQIFPKFAGMDFSGLFQRFRLPQLDSNNLSITHGFDSKTRRAWVNSTVKFAHPAYEELFAFGPVALGLAKMKFDAFTGVETRFDGLKPLPPSVKTTANLTGDWTLLGGGQRIVTFRELAIQYDGASGFHFDVSPDNIELHPSLKFISEFVQQFKKDLPPAIEIIEEGGRPVGVRAGTTVVLDDLPDLGVVTIGPIDMRSSLGLKLDKGRFLINSAFSLGNKQMPIFVQISWLGGGCWLETQATYVDGRVDPSISVGLSVGSTRAFNLASVASGSFNVQLYCYVEVRGNSSSVAIGFSLCGSALIVGFVNASVNLLLEAQHSGGETKGTGRLDVSVKISWVYTFRYKTSVNHKF